MENHRNALSALKTIAQSLCREVEGWKSNVVALQKMRLDEEKAFKKVQEKEAKAAERRSVQEKKKQEKLEKQRAAREAAAEKGKGAGGEGDAAEGKRRKRRTGGLTELTDEDPPVLRDMSKFTEANMSMVDNVKDFADHIGANPRFACVARVKKGMFKKVLTESFLHHSVSFGFCIVLLLHLFAFALVWPLHHGYITNI